jgi:hypothetical protein
MRSIKIADERISSLLDVGDPGAPEGEGTDLVVRLKDGRGFSVPVLTLRALERRLAEALSFVSAQVLVVRELTDEALTHAVRTALDRGLEHFGTFQSPLEE